MDKPTSREGKRRTRGFGNWGVRPSVSERFTSTVGGRAGSVFSGGGGTVFVRSFKPLLSAFSLPVSSSVLGTQGSVRHSYVLLGLSV